MSSTRSVWYLCQEDKIFVGKLYAPQTLWVLDYSVGVVETAKKDRRVRLDICCFQPKKVNVV